MRTISKKIELCFDCMEEHEVSIVEVEHIEIFKEKEVIFKAIFSYCSNTKSYMANEKMMKYNNLRMKDAYRRAMGLLTSSDIKELRIRYSVSAKDFAKILGWGDTTIIRYENHQVQDKVHNDMLCEILKRPSLFLEKLEKAKDILSKKAYEKYYTKAANQYYSNKNNILIELIKANYIKLDKKKYMGNQNLDTIKVSNLINYIIQSVEEVYKTQLMNLLLCIDLHVYKENKQSLTGLAYYISNDGVEPVASKFITELDGIYAIEKTNNSKVVFTKTQMNSNLDFFSIKEKDILNKVIDSYKKKPCNIEVKDIIESSKMRQLINYQKAVVTLI